MLVIIGSGLAGYMLAKEWRKLDAKTPLTIVTENQGDFYSKPLLSSALTQKKTALDLAITSAEGMAKQLNATIYTNAIVESIDPDARTLRFFDKDLKYDQLVLALGSSPLSLTLEGNAACECISVNDLEAYAKFRNRLAKNRKKIAVLGTGLVGCEFANDLLNAGYSVDLVSMEAYPLQKFVPEKIGESLQKAFSEKGARWHFGTAAEKITYEGFGLCLHLKDGRKIMAEEILSAVGLKANIELARRASLRVNQGIVVDRSCQTSAAAIYALGDCAEVEGHLKQYVAPLLHCARTLANVLVGQREVVHYPCMPIVIKTPACPLVVCPPPQEVLGEWRYAGEGKDLSAFYFDLKNELRGFALMGDKIREKMEWIQKIPLVF